MVSEGLSAHGEWIWVSAERVWNWDLEKCYDWCLRALSLRRLFRGGCLVLGLGLRCWPHWVSWRESRTPISYCTAGLVPKSNEGDLYKCNRQTWKSIWKRPIQFTVAIIVVPLVRR